MKFGLSKPIIARRTGNKTYADGFVCGEAMQTSVTPNYAEGSLYGDNKMVASRKKFKNAAVTIGTTKLPIIANQVIFGHQVDEYGGIVKNVNDTENYIGYGFISKEERNDKTEYVGAVLYKVKFSETEDSYETEGDNISFKTPSISGTALPEENGDWITTKPFGTEEAAEEWIKGILQITPKCQTPTASLAAGTYDTAQTVTLTAQDGSTIYYTTDGTTPSKTHGTKYTAAINIASTTMLKAVATATGKADSEVLSGEYIIVSA